MAGKMPVVEDRRSGETSIIKTKEDGARVRILLTREGPKEFPLPKEGDDYG